MLRVPLEIVQGLTQEQAYLVHDREASLVSGDLVSGANAIELFQDVPNCGKDRVQTKNGQNNFISQWIADSDNTKSVTCVSVDTKQPHEDADRKLHRK